MSFQNNELIFRVKDADTVHQFQQNLVELYNDVKQVGNVCLSLSLEIHCSMGHENLFFIEEITTEPVVCRNSVNPLLAELGKAIVRAQDEEGEQLSVIKVVAGRMTCKHAGEIM